MDSTQSSTDSVKIKIKVRGRSEKDTLFFATIVFKNKKPVEGMMSDIDGNIEFSLTKSQDMCAFTLSMVGYANSEYSISSDKNYTITCFLEENGFDIFYKTGEIHKYHIRNIKKDSFELKNDYKDAKFEIYKRREKIEK
jgi:hypothetical protein